MELREVGIYWSEFQRGRGVPSWNGENSRGFGAVGDSRALQEVGMSNIPSPGGGKSSGTGGEKARGEKIWSWKGKIAELEKGKIWNWGRENSRVGEGKDPKLEKGKIQNWERKRSGFGEGKNPDLQKGKNLDLEKGKIQSWRRERS